MRRIKVAKAEKNAKMNTTKPNYLDLHRDWKIIIFEWFFMIYFSSCYKHFQKNGHIVILFYSRAKIKIRQNNNLIFIFLLKGHFFFPKVTQSHTSISSVTPLIIVINFFRIRKTLILKWSFLMKVRLMNESTKLH